MAKQKEVKKARTKSATNGGKLELSSNVYKLNLTFLRERLDPMREAQELIDGLSKVLSFCQESVDDNTREIVVATFGQVLNRCAERMSGNLQLAYLILHSMRERPQDHAYLNALQAKREMAEEGD